MNSQKIQARADNIFLKRHSRPNSNYSDPLSTRVNVTESLVQENEKLSRRLDAVRSGQNPQAESLEASGYLSAAQVCNITGQRDEFLMRKTLENIPHRLDDNGKCVYHKSDVGKFLQDVANGKSAKRFL